MPMHEGRYVSVQRWRELQAASQGPVPLATRVDPVPEPDAEPAQPRRRNSRKRDAAAQVMEAMGITPDMTEDTDESADPAPVVATEPGDASEAAGDEEAAGAESGDASGEENA